MADEFDTLVEAVGRAREAHRAVSEDRERLSHTLSQERRARAEQDANRDVLLAHEAERRSLAERRAASVEQELVTLRAELDELSRRPVRVEDAERETAALTADLGMSRREAKRLAARAESLQDRLVAAEAKVKAAEAQVQRAVADARHDTKRHIERLQGQVHELTSQKVALAERLTAAEQQAERARSAMLDHAARA